MTEYYARDSSGMFVKGKRRFTKPQALGAHMVINLLMERFTGRAYHHGLDIEILNLDMTPADVSASILDSAWASYNFSRYGGAFSFSKEIYHAVVEMSKRYPRPIVVFPSTDLNLFSDYVVVGGVVVAAATDHEMSLARLSRKILTPMDQSGRTGEELLLIPLE